MDLSGPSTGPIAVVADISPAARSSLKTVHWTVLLAFGQTFLTARGVIAGERSFRELRASSGGSL